jgi:hypothetical protein
VMSWRALAGGQRGQTARGAARGENGSFGRGDRELSVSIPVLKTWELKPACVRQTEPQVDLKHQGCVKSGMGKNGRASLFVGTQADKPRVWDVTTLA